MNFNFGFPAFKIPSIDYESLMPETCIGDDIRKILEQLEKANVESYRESKRSFLISIIALFIAAASLIVVILSYFETVAKVLFWLMFQIFLK